MVPWLQCLLSSGNNPQIICLLAIGYARLSTLEPQADLDAQQRDLKTAACEKIFVDRGDPYAQRVMLDQALAFVREGDVFVCCWPDLVPLLKIEADLARRRIGLIVLSTAARCWTRALPGLGSNWRYRPAWTAGNGQSRGKAGCGHRCGQGAWGRLQGAHSVDQSRHRSGARPDGACGPHAPPSGWGSPGPRSIAACRRTIRSSRSRGVFPASRSTQRRSKSCCDRGWARRRSPRTWRALRSSSYRLRGGR
jgi:hypothetical protein